MQKVIFKIQGMHCASCEILIEKRILEANGVKSVDASTGRGEVEITCEGEAISKNKLNKMFATQGYKFFGAQEDAQYEPSANLSTKDKVVVAVSAVILIVGFIILHKSGLSSLVDVSSRSALPVFLLFGVMAGLSSCAALVGGIVLSMSKQWSELYGEEESSFKRMQPHLLFNLGRLLSYGLLGGVLGTIGGVLRLSLTWTSILIFAVSIMMVGLGLQMLGVKYFRKFQIAVPKFITRFVADESKFRGKYMPIVMGAMTFFLPCGFTITAQGLALASGSMSQGALIMLFFALGTLPVLLVIAWSSVALTKKPHVANRFLRVAGVLVLFFAIFNINSQLNAMGLKSFDDIGLNRKISVKTTTQAKKAVGSSLPEIVNGKQVVKMNASVYGYNPNYIKVRANVPVRWEVTDTGTSGCTNAIIARDFFSGQIQLERGKVSVKEFTPKNPGKYKFSCWMGMVTGTIEVVASDECEEDNGVCKF